MVEHHFCTLVQFNVVFESELLQLPSLQELQLYAIFEIYAADKYQILDCHQNILPEIENKDDRKNL